MMSNRLAARWRPILVVAIAAGVLAPYGAALGQDIPDSERAEEKKKELEEKEAERRRRREELEKEAVKETAAEKEERIAEEKRVQALALARAKAESSRKLAKTGKLKPALAYMQEAARLDPKNPNYYYLVAFLAREIVPKGARDTQLEEVEFVAAAHFVNLAKKSTDYKVDGAEERSAELSGRLEILRKRVTAGTMEITSKPPEADIFVDGAYIGTGKGSIELPTGQRRVTAAAKDYLAFQGDYSCRIGDPSVYAIELTPRTYHGSLVVKVLPAEDVKVYLDEKLVGTTPWKGPMELVAKQYLLRLEKNGFERWARKIRVERDKTYTLEAEMERIGSTGP